MAYDKNLPPFLTLRDSVAPPLPTMTTAKKKTVTNLEMDANFVALADAVQNAGGGGGTETFVLALATNSNQPNGEWTDSSSDAYFNWDMRRDTKVATSDNSIYYVQSVYDNDTGSYSKPYIVINQPGAYRVVVNYMWDMFYGEFYDDPTKPVTYIKYGSRLQFAKSDNITNWQDQMENMDPVQTPGTNFNKPLQKIHVSARPNSMFSYDDFSTNVEDIGMNDEYIIGVQDLNIYGQVNMSVGMFYDFAGRNYGYSNSLRPYMVIDIEKLSGVVAPPNLSYF